MPTARPATKTKPRRAPDNDKRERILRAAIKVFRCYACEHVVSDRA